ncbi:hypothetical protein BJ508DRAFT_350176 [Ascobolus immersus RN42]|uniref:Uncharacterized protein n=1 Tax=Ascobolus immersus RN42 TaxID=1160509 RepID=A0A3N4HWX6_ASCIM|nr:hypothetical protein BJ508DRAFT_350176 [Ascobolus immersus RN42]
MYGVLYLSVPSLAQQAALPHLLLTLIKPHHNRSRSSPQIYHLRFNFPNVKLQLLQSHPSTMKLPSTILLTLLALTTSPFITAAPIANSDDKLAFFPFGLTCKGMYEVCFPEQARQDKLREKERQKALAAKPKRAVMEDDVEEKLAFLLLPFLRDYRLRKLK